MSGHGPMPSVLAGASTRLRAAVSLPETSTISGNTTLSSGSDSVTRNVSGPVPAYGYGAPLMYVTKSEGVDDAKTVGESR